MNPLARLASSFFLGKSPGFTTLNIVNNYYQNQQWRGIRVRVGNLNLEQALKLMQRKMQSSGIERLIKRDQTYHLKNSEKRVLARKMLERKVRSQEFSRKLKAIFTATIR